MSNFSDITIHARLTRDVETRAVGEHTVSNVGVAYDVGFGEKAHPVFIDVSAWNKTGEALARLMKGDQVLLNGELDMETWTDKTTQQKRTKHVLKVSRVVYTSKKKDGAEATPAATRPTSPAVAKAFGDEVPF